MHHRLKFFVLKSTILFLNGTDWFIFQTIQLLIDTTVSWSEFGKYFLFCWKFTLHPRMSNQIRHHKSPWRIIVKHCPDNILELYRIMIFFLMLLHTFPKLIKPMFGIKKFIKSVIFVSHIFKWLMTCSHCEKYDSKCV